MASLDGAKGRAVPLGYPGPAYVQEPFTGGKQGRSRASRPLLPPEEGRRGPEPTDACGLQKPERLRPVATVGTEASVCEPRKGASA